MQNYELTVVLPGNMPEAKQKAVLEKIKKSIADSDGEVAKVDEWGKKTLAYPIKKEKEGYYYYLELSLPTERTAGINRLIVNDEQVLRHLLVVKNTKSIEGAKRTKGKAKMEESDKEPLSPEPLGSDQGKLVEVDSDVSGVDKAPKKAETKSKGRSVKSTISARNTRSKKE